MNKLFFIFFLLVTISFTTAQNTLLNEEVLKKQIRIELSNNDLCCNFLTSKKAISNFNKKTEIWSINDTKKGSRVIIIESFLNDTYFQEVYFIKNGRLRYVKETENYNPINGFAQMKWNCEYFFSKGKLVTVTSLGHGKTEDENWNPNSILNLYTQRISEFKRLKNE